MRFYEYLFYTYYRSAKGWGWESSPVASAVFTMSILVMFGWTLLGKIEHAMLNSSVLSSSFREMPTFISTIIIFGANYLLLARRKRFHKIVRQFVDESKESRLRRSRLAWAFFWIVLLGTFGFLLYG